MHISYDILTTVSHREVTGWEQIQNSQQRTAWKIRTMLYNFKDCFRTIQKMIECKDTKKKETKWQ